MISTRDDIRQQDADTLRQVWEILDGSGHRQGQCEETNDVIPDEQREQREDVFVQNEIGRAHV
jgi:hypothetical protein